MTAQDSGSLGSLSTGVDTVGFFAGLLSGYEPSSILREQAQNADDACVSQGREGRLWVSIEEHEIRIENPSLLSEDDWRRLARTSSRGKARDESQTGEFGVGFWSVLHLTDAPIVTSGNLTACIDQFSGIDPPFEPAAEEIDGTRFVLPLRRKQTDIGERLEIAPVGLAVLRQLEADFASQIQDLLLFTTALDEIVVVGLDGFEQRGTRSAQALGDGLERVEVSIEQPGGTSVVSYLRLTTEVPNPPPGRRGRVSAAFPLDSAAALGRIFCTFPTEIVTGLPFSINAHFFAAMDRRSIVNGGQNGQWNDAIYGCLGRAIGEQLEVIFSTEIPLTWDDRARWFVGNPGVAADVLRRSSSLIRNLDEVARVHPTVPDRLGQLRRGSDVVVLDHQAGELIGPFVENAAAPCPPDLTPLLDRWGVQRWGTGEVSAWVQAHAPHETTEVTDAPGFMNSTTRIKNLLVYLSDRGDELRGKYLAVGTDNQLYSLGSDDLRRPTEQVAELAKGLTCRGVHPDLSGTVAWTYAPRADGQWFRDVLQLNITRFVGKRVPTSGVGALGSLAKVNEALDLVGAVREGCLGLPLAIGTDLRADRFDSSTVVGVKPSTVRKAVTQLLERCGARCLHEKTDDEQFSGGGIRRFSARTLTEIVLAAPSWDPVSDTLPLVQSMELLLDSNLAEPNDFKELVAAEIWLAADGSRQSLMTLKLPSDTGALHAGQSSQVLSADAIDLSSKAGRQARDCLIESFGMVPLDATEVTVAACEGAPTDLAELLVLLEDLVECRSKLQPVQQKRLRRAAFVPCLDRRLRSPSEVLLPKQSLPGSLGDRSVAEEAEEVGGFRRLLLELGAREVPDPDELVGIARWIAEQPVSDERDPAFELWNFLDFEEQVSSGVLAQLGEIPWLPTNPSGSRKEPNQLVDPTLGFAALLFASPRGVRQSSVRLRDGLGIRGSLTPTEYGALARNAAETNQALGDQFFYQLDRLARTDDGAREVAGLQSIPFIPTSGGLAAPSSLVEPSRAHLWGHLRKQVPGEFVERYVALVRAVGICRDEEVSWRDHLEVLDELARTGDLDERGVRLARERFGSLADLHGNGLGDLNSLVNRRCIPTSKGLVRPEDAFLGDHPPAIVERLEDHLPVIRSSPALDDFLRDLSVGSLRGAVQLIPDAVGAQVDKEWPPRLMMQAANVHRYLNANGDRGLGAVAAQWPPEVQVVNELAIRAFRDGSEVSRWKEVCFLHLSLEEELVLLLTGDRADARAVADAIATLFGVGASKKTLLVQVLQSASHEAGEEALDYDGVPRIETDVSFDWTPTEVEIDIPVYEPEPEPDQEVDYSGGSSRPGPGSDDIIEFQPAEPANEDKDLAGSPVSVVEAPDVNQGVVDTRESQPRPEGLPDRPTAPKVRSDWDGIESEFNIEQRFERPVDEVDFGADDPASPHEPRRRRCVLSFYDVKHGLFPLRATDVRSLAGAVPLTSVHLFGELYGASVADSHHVRIEGGVEMFQERMIVPGVVVHLSPGAPGSIEATINEAPHTIDDVWILELEESGALRRERLHGIEVKWECEDGVYRPERRWEDLPALQAEATASALDLTIRVFKRYGADGLTVTEVWQLVAAHRLFALSTVRSMLARQSGLFERRGDHWFMVGDTVYRDVVANPIVEPRTDDSVESKLRKRVRDLARKLASALNDLDDDGLREQTVSSLGLIAVSRGVVADIERACLSYLSDAEPVLLHSIRKDLGRHPERAAIITGWLDRQAELDLDAASHLLDAVTELGTPHAVAESRLIRERLAGFVPHHRDAPATAGEAEQVYQLLVDGKTTQAHVVDVMVSAYVGASSPSVDQLFESPGELYDVLVRLERIRDLDSSGVSDTEEVIGARQAALDAAVAALGDTDRHVNPARQQMLAVARLLQGDTTGVLDVMKEYGLLVAEHGNSPDAGAVFAAAARFAKRGDVGSNTAKFVADRADADARCSAAVRTFLDDWCRFARIEGPTR